MTISSDNPVRSFFFLKLDRIYLTCFTAFIITYCCMGIAFEKFRLLLLFFYALISILTGAYFLVYKKTYKDSFNIIIAALFFIYLFWLSLAVYYDNILIYIFQDSVGFLFYLAYIPLSFILIRFASVSFYDNIVCYIGLVVAVLHGIIYGLYYLAIGSGDLTNNEILLFNSMLQNVGFSKSLGGAYGLLRIDIGLGQLLIIPFAISVNRILKEKKMLACKYQLSFVSIIIIGAIFNGNRSLLITLSLALGFLLIFSIRYHKITYHRFFMFVFAMVLIITSLLFILKIMGLYDISILYDRMVSLFVFDKYDIGNEARFGQIPALLKKISERPLIGSGFGSYAEILRNDERPFMYEVEYLAIVMKLGVIGAVLYVGSYVVVLIKGYNSLRNNFNRAAPYVSAGAAYLFYMGTNGGFAMSLFSTLFHVMIMLGITNSFKRQCIINNHPSD